MKNSIRHISTYFPSARLSNDNLLTEFPNLKLKELTRLTGVENRYISSIDETSVDMGYMAAENLFSEFNINKEDIGQLIFCSAGGDYITPASACILHEKLGLSANCGAFDFNQGCTGYLYGLQIADGIISSGNTTYILLITSEAITKTIHPKDGSNRAIFGDGATATLIAHRNSLKGGKFIFGTDGSKFDKIIIKHGRERYPISENAVADTVDSYGNVVNPANFFMDGSEVFNFSVSKAPELVGSLLKAYNASFDDIDHFIFHQANQIILETLGRKLRIPESKLIIDIINTGNTVSSTIPIALSNGIKTGRIKKGDKILLAGFGVGFSWGGTIVEL